MHTSTQNRISKDEQITPDAIIQLSTQVGLVSEIKASLPEDKTHWRTAVDQLLKYDDDLVGWWTPNERIPTHNVVFLIEQTRSIAFRNYLFDLREQGSICFDDVLCGISFVRTNGLSERILFELRWGKISDTQLSTKLEEGKSIPLEKVKASYGNIKFYDFEPEIEYLISVIWICFLNVRKSDLNYDPKKKRFLINVTPLEIARELQRSFGSQVLQSGSANMEYEQRQVEFPQVSWIRKALDYLVAIDFAKKNSSDSYTVLYKLIRVDIISYFAKKGKRGKQKEPEPRQRKLFNESNP